MTSSSVTPTRKRARTASITVVDESNLWKRHPSLYMPDGTIVLHANDTVFRVYHGLLSMQSEVFKDMSSFSECQPRDAEMYDGCPLVRMTDTKTELAYFLEMTMSIRRFHVKKPTSFARSASTLSLSTKYMAASLRGQAIEHFQRIIPRKFEDIGKQEDYKQVFGTGLPHPFQVVSLFQKCHLRHFLPWAYYVACKEGFEALLKSCATQNGGFLSISQADALIALGGWKKLYDEDLSNRLNIIMSRASNCESRADNSIRQIWVKRVSSSVRNNFLEQWESFNKSFSEPPGHSIRYRPSESRTFCCSKCNAVWLEQDKKSRSKMWDNLPQTFGLPSWEVLLRGENVL